ncbi:pyruvate/2-oxoglutarate dehydrogenase complex dihydrolipoamide acyltransferase (E2) component [Sphingopyxis panaciterrae]|uniref:2-oxo acid dehydrogenase subunit E2 n=1 Tax=Sphingopyxis panaciterrae TaxID=363841 RepID=UPI00141DB1DC|nr:2-oxo acid dehydrogenase subunit E2 [Sphingopyxis panaciterrae]NIJ37701.1 pyruvate/2-oxoglutarate dehydrogenase complex dihydrolipoamide acyltransferase (E2) component [Sphingopyxis panaciterrae]
MQKGEDVLHRFKRVDVSRTVAIEDGLVTPVLCGVEALSLSAIAKVFMAVFRDLVETPLVILGSR